jgi:5-(carboxyamino)imidazole ribonucleotide synthase
VNVGILGAGQLGRMLALAGFQSGLSFRFYDSARDAPAGQIAPLTVGAFDDLEGLKRWAEGLDVITYEFENVPTTAASHLSAIAPVYPPPAALEKSQDRLVEKTFFRSLGIPTPDFAPVNTPAECSAALAEIGLPAVLKTRRMGYDGKGQVILDAQSNIESACDAIGRRGGQLILEQFVRFDRELSVIAARGMDGSVVLYPLVENEHGGGILRISRSPAPDVSQRVWEQAERHARAVLSSLGYVGVLAIEFFLVGDTLLANEMAPRVHNSGHWSIEGARTSQFENHIRAILGWPLGSTESTGNSGMVNIIGGEPEVRSVLALGAHLHMYGKHPRPGRKLGHATIVDRESGVLECRLQELRAVIERSNC